MPAPSTPSDDAITGMMNSGRNPTPTEVGTQRPEFFSGTPEPDFIDGRSGDDYIFGGFADDTLVGATGDDTLAGSYNNDTLLGGPGDDSLDGGEHNDFVSGGPGNDTLLGDSGSRPGVDVLEGGPGADVFIFVPLVPVQTPVVDTGVGEGNRDVILDFRSGRDVINLSAYERYLGPFHGPEDPLFLGTGAFVDSGALQVRYDVLADGRAVVHFLGAAPVALPPTLQPETRLEGEIELIGVRHLSAEDFILA